MPHSAYLVKGYRPGSFEAQMISKPSVKFGQSGKFPAVPSGVRRVSLFSQVLLLLLVSAGAGCERSGPEVSDAGTARVTDGIGRSLSILY